MAHSKKGVRRLEVAGNGTRKFVVLWCVGCRLGTKMMHLGGGREFIVFPGGETCLPDKRQDACLFLSRSRLCLTRSKAGNKDKILHPDSLYYP